MISFVLSSLLLVSAAYIILIITTLTSMICTVENIGILLMGAVRIDMRGYDILRDALFEENQLTTCQALMGEIFRTTFKSSWEYGLPTTKLIESFKPEWPIDIAVVLCIGICCFLAWKRNFRERLSMEIKG